MTKKKKKRLDSLRRLGTVYYELDGQSWRRTILLTQLWDFSEEMRGRGATGIYSEYLDNYGNAHVDVHDEILERLERLEALRARGAKV